MYRWGYITTFATSCMVSLLIAMHLNGLVAMNRVEYLMQQNLEAAIQRALPPARRICQDIMDKRDVYTREQLLNRLTALSTRLNKMYPGDSSRFDYFFPEDVDIETKNLIRNMLNLYSLTQISVEKCTMPGNERERKHRYNYHELQQILIQQLTTSGSDNMAQFINYFYRQQLDICRANLLNQFRTKVENLLRPATQYVVKKTQDDLLSSFSNVDAIEQIDKANLIYGIASYNNLSNIRDQLADSAVKIGSLEKTIELRFNYHCGAFFLDPFKTLMETSELSGGQLQSQLETEFNGWLRCYRICQQSRLKLTSSDWEEIAKNVTHWLGDEMIRAKNSDQVFKTRSQRRTYKSMRKSEAISTAKTKTISSGNYDPIKMASSIAPNKQKSKKRKQLMQNQPEQQLITQFNDQSDNQEAEILERIRANLNRVLPGSSEDFQQVAQTDKPDLNKDNID